MASRLTHASASMTAAAQGWSLTATTGMNAGFVQVLVNSLETWNAIQTVDNLAMASHFEASIETVWPVV